jgi:hypothetical protein
VQASIEPALPARCGRPAGLLTRAEFGPEGPLFAPEVCARHASLAGVLPRPFPPRQLFVINAASNAQPFRPPVVVAHGRVRNGDKRTTFLHASTNPSHLHYDFVF